MNICSFIFNCMYIAIGPRHMHKHTKCIISSHRETNYWMFESIEKNEVHHREVLAKEFIYKVK